MTSKYLSILFHLTFILYSAISGVKGRLSDQTSASTTNHARETSTSIARTTNTNPFQINTMQASMCDYIHPNELPQECTCHEPAPYSLVIECLKSFQTTYLNDTIGMKIDMDPCNIDGATVSLDLEEKNYGIDYSIMGIRAGASKNIPIPGLSFVVPEIGDVGLDVAIYMAENPDVLTLKIGLNACAQLKSHQRCASSIPGLSSVLPWYVLSGTYSFGDICDSRIGEISDLVGREQSQLALVD